MVDAKKAAFDPTDAAHDLPPDVVQRIDEQLARLDSMDHYALLGIPRGATRAEARSAFLRAAPLYHPDRYFGKRLGPYAARMQRVLDALSLAHETLDNEAKRAQYDATLPASSAPPPTPPRHKPFTPGAHPPSEPPARPPSDRPSAVMRTATPSAADVERARHQFAARLRGSTPAQAFHAAGKVPPIPQAGIPRPPTPSASSTGSNPAIDPQMAVEALKRRYEESRQSRGGQSALHVKAAQDAEARGDFVEAARLYRIATTTSSDAMLKVASETADSRAKKQLLDQTLQRAREAEQRQELPEAAVAWAKAFELSPTGENAHRAALAFLRAGQDPRRARKYGEEAVKLEPNKVPYRLTLARIYFEGGLLLRARGEVERALSLEPNNPAIRDAATRLLKGR